MERGLSRDQLADEIANMRDYEFRNPRSDWDRVARSWLRKVRRHPDRADRALPRPSQLDLEIANLAGQGR